MDGNPTYIKEEISEERNNASIIPSEEGVEFLFELQFEQIEELKRMLLESDPSDPEIQALME